MSKAEERALEKYPKRTEWVGSQWDGVLFDVNSGSRAAYIEGYHQAEKDNGLTLEVQEEPITASEDLEEAAKHYLYSNILYDDVYVGNPTEKDCIEMFKAGAKLQKEQMLKDAKESEVVITNKGILLSDLRIEDFNYEDKVKIIILKE